MNFVDAAVALLREASGPMHVEELCRLALERGLLDSPGTSPLRSLKGRLTTELKRGPESRVVRVEDDLWALAEANGATEPSPGVEAASDEAEVDEEAAADLAPSSPESDTAGEAEGEGEAYGFEDDEDEEDDEDDEDDDEDEAEADPDEDEDVDDEDEDEAGEGEDDDEDEDEEDEDDEDADEEEALGVEDAQEGEVVDEQEAAAQQQRLALEREGLSPEEKDLVQAYGAETGTAQMGSLVEYRDGQTADEDRPMVPETLPERRGRGREDWKARRDRMRDKRRERREERDRNKAARDKPGTQAAGAQPARATEADAGEGEAVSARAPAGERPAPEGAAPGEGAAQARRELPAAPAGDADLARRACEVLASIKGAQPVPVRQLAQMMRKRRLVQVEPDLLWRPLKSALLADHQRRAAAGLPPRVAYRGRDLFSYRPSANAELEAVETALEIAAHRLRGATERALAARLVELPLPVLEQVAQLFLVQSGWRDLEWIKRVDRSGYATARERGDGPPVMLAIRAGNQEVDRRGVGELRAGVAAKNLARGLLLAPRELSADARAELDRPGKPVGALCGLPWASALVDAGIGVALRAMPVAYLDAELFDRLSEG